MQHLQKLIKPIERKSGRPINERFEKAKEFGEYVGISPIVVMRLFKLYGEERVLKIRSWLKDIPYDNRKGGKIALAHWKLKEKTAILV